MNAGVEVALLVPVAYLLGTFPSATLVARRPGHRHHRRGLGQPGRVEHLPAPRAGRPARSSSPRLRQGRARRRRRPRGRRPPRRLRARRRRRPRATSPGDPPVQGRPGRGDRRGRDARDLPAARVGWSCVGRARAVTHKASVASLHGRDRVPDRGRARGSRRRGHRRDRRCWRCSWSPATSSNLRRLVQGEELGLDPGRRTRRTADVGDERAAS